MDYRDLYNDWLSNPYFDDDTKAELEAIKTDEKEIEDRFYKELEFGTAGLRGVIGAGTNRMNIYTVRKATQGLANYIIKMHGQDRGVAIAYDSRHMSPEFADEAALCLNANGIKAYVFDALRPTPELSFAVTVTGIIVILLFIVDCIKNTLTIFNEIARFTGIENGLVKILLKIVGIGYLTEFAAGVLTDFGSQSVADKVVLGGKITIIIMSFPIIQSLLTLVGGFLKLV